MDTLETYIKMCEKAIEIQTHEPEAWDYYYLNVKRKYFDDINGVVVLSGYETASGYYGPDPEYLEDSEGVKIWLPCQDQLQEMVADQAEIAGIHVNIALLYRLVEFADTIHPEYPTMEQLWLAFVMKKKFGKTWDGENWTLEANALPIPLDKPDM